MGWPEHTDGSGHAPTAWPELAEWVGRRYWTYRFNLLEHIGHLSARAAGTYGEGAGADASAPLDAGALRGTRGRLCYPACYAPLQYVGLMPDENFSDACLASTLSPCAACAADAVARGLARRRAGAACVGLPFPSLLAKVEAFVRTGAC